MNEEFLGDRWLFSRLNEATLAALTPGGLHSGDAPSDASGPYVRYFLVAGTDPAIINGAVIWTNMLYQVEAWAKGNDKAVLARITKRVHERLQLAEGTQAATASGTGGGTIFMCKRVGILPAFSERIEGGGIVQRRASSPDR